MALADPQLVAFSAVAVWRRGSMDWGGVGHDRLGLTLVLVLPPRRRASSGCHSLVAAPRAAPDGPAARCPGRAGGGGVRRGMGSAGAGPARRAITTSGWRAISPAATRGCSTGRGATWATCWRSTRPTSARRSCWRRWQAYWLARRHALRRWRCWRLHERRRRDPVRHDGQFATRSTTCRGCCCRAGRRRGPADRAHPRALAGLCRAGSVGHAGRRALHATRVRPGAAGAAATTRRSTSRMRRRLRRGGGRRGSAPQRAAARDRAGG